MIEKLPKDRSQWLQSLPIFFLLLEITFCEFYYYHGISDDTRAISILNFQHQLFLVSDYQTDNEITRHLDDSFNLEIYIYTYTPVESF